MQEKRILDIRELTSLQSVSTSKGNQRKWYDPGQRLYVKGQFFYQGKYWRDDLVEILASAIAEQLPMRDAQVVWQHPCEIWDGKTRICGVCSKDFTREGERFVSFRRLLDLTGQDYEMTDSVEDNWNRVHSVLDSFVETDITEYLIVMSLLDYLVGNEDRHLNNFGLLSDGRKFRQAPLFDFGLGLFEHDRRYEGESFRGCLALMQCMPFADDNQRVVDFLMKNSMLQDYLPKALDLTEYEVSSPKADSYLRNRCRNLGINLKTVVFCRILDEDNVPYEYRICQNPRRATWFFLEDRVVPSTRIGIGEDLKKAGLAYYDPTLLLKFNHGYSVSDHYWIRFEGEELTYAQLSEWAKPEALKGHNAG